MTTSRSLLGALLVFIILSSIYATAVVTIDDTNIGTTNGLWKAPTIRQWELGTTHKLDNGEWLYMPLYGHLCRLIPDRWVSYGTTGPMLTFRKMALLNALFGGLASAVVFLLATRFLSSAIAAFVVMLGHSCAAFVIVNSINSEDIIPAYTSFVLMTFFLFEYLRSNRLVYLVVAAFCCAMLTVLHWTLMIPALAGMAAVGLLLLLKEPRKAWILPVFFGLFLCFLWLFMLGFGHIQTIGQILLPGKAGPSGWLGLRWNKFLFSFIGIGNYLLGGHNLTDYHFAFGDKSILRSMGVSWIFTIATLAALIWALFRRGSSQIVRLLAVFGLAVFFMGQAEHVYSQPQDPQSQIQPMFQSTLGVILILEAAQRAENKYVSPRLAALSLGAFFVLVGAYNARLMMMSRGDDSRSMKEAEELKRTFPPDTTVIVSQGWEMWNAWVKIETYNGEYFWYRSRNIGLVNGFLDVPGMQPAVAADAMGESIADHMSLGHRVVTNVLWVGSKDDLAFGLTILVDIEQARTYLDRLENKFHAGKTWDTPVGRFVELERN